MNASLDSSAGERWVLAGDLDFDSVCGLLAQSRTAFQDAPPRQVDLGRVGRSNSAGLALLVEWMSWVAAAGGRLEFARIPDSLRRLASISGLELPEAATG